MAISFVKVVGITSTKTNGTGLGTTLAANCAGGNLIVVIFTALPSGTPANVTVNDTRYGTTGWSQAVGDSAGTLDCYIWYKILPAGGLLTGDVISWGNDNQLDVMCFSVLEFSGINPNSPLDKTQSSAETTSTAADSGATATTAQAQELLIGLIAVNGPTGETFAQNGDGTGGTWTIPAGARSGTTGAGSTTNATANVMYRIASATGAYSARGTLGTSHVWQAFIATFKGGLGFPTDQGVFTVAGQPVTLARSRIMSAGQGSFAVAGQPVTLTKGAAPAPFHFVERYNARTYAVRTVVAPVGSGEAIPPIAAPPRTLSATPGSFNVAGQDVNLIYTPTTPPTPYTWLDQRGIGTYALTAVVAPLDSGRAPAVVPAETVTVDKWHVPPPYPRRASRPLPYRFQVAVAREAIAQNYSMTAATGSFTITGQAVGLIYTPPTPYTWLDQRGAGTYKIRTVIAPVAIGDVARVPAPPRTLVASAASFTVAGQAVGLLHKQTLPVALGTFAVAGQAVALSRGRNLSITRGLYTVTGSLTGLRATRRLVIDPGVFTLTGRDLNFRRWRVAGVSGVYTVTGQPVALVHNKTGTFENLPILNTEGFLITAINSQWSLLTADFGDGFMSAQNQCAEGLRSWSIRIDVLPGDVELQHFLVDDLTPAYALVEDGPPGHVLTETGGRILLDHASTRAAYLWRFFRLSKQKGDQPFWIEVEDPETATRTQYLANFIDHRLSYEVLCAKVYGTGLEISERRLPPPVAIPV